MPASTPADYENILARLQGVRSLVDQTIALMEQGLAAGMTPPRIAIRDVPDQVRAQIVADPAESPLLAAFAAWPEAIPEAGRRRLAARAHDVYRQSVAPAFERLHRFLSTRYLPSCREPVGMDALPHGAAMYAYNVGWHTTSDKTPQQIHQIGLAETPVHVTGADLLVQVDVGEGGLEEVGRGRDGLQGVVEQVRMDNDRRGGCHRLLGIEHRRHFTVVGPYEPNGLFGDGRAVCRHRGHRFADETHYPSGEERSVPHQTQSLVRDVLRRQYPPDTGQTERCRGIYAKQAGMRVGTAEYSSVKHVGELHVNRIPRPAGDLLKGVQPDDILSHYR